MISHLEVNSHLSDVPLLSTLIGTTSRRLTNYVRTNEQLSSMDITQFVMSHRQDALLRDDYNSYRVHLSRRLLSTRRRLGRTTAKGKKYSGTSLGTAEDIAKNHESVLFRAHVR